MSNRKRYILPVVLALGLAFAAPAEAQFSTHHGSFSVAQEPLETDWACFLADDSGRLQLEIYYQIYNFGFQFEEVDGEFIAQYELVVHVFDGDDKLVESSSRDRQIRTPSRLKTTSRLDFRTSQVSVVLPPGKYKVEVTALDKANDRVYRKDFKVELEDVIRGTPRMSGVEFVQAFSKADSGANVFAKSDLIVVPSVTRAYGGGEGQGRLLYYFEIYPGQDSVSKVIVETKVRHRSQGMLYRDTLHVNFTGETVRQLREISLEYFSPGEYELEMSLRGRRNKKLQDATFNFQVLWTLEGVVRHDWKTTLRQLAIIAEPGELDGMKDLEGIEERRDAFRNFWLERDPTPGTEENEALDEFYRRIHIANHHFAAMLRDGWTTDRGRIFIEYGSPDQIDDVPFSTEARPYQIWHYYTTARYLRFLFIDENEDGEYRLQYPYDGLNQQPDF